MTSPTQLLLSAPPPPAAAALPSTSSSEFSALLLLAVRFLFGYLGGEKQKCLVQPDPEVWQVLQGDRRQPFVDLEIRVAL